MTALPFSQALDVVTQALRAGVSGHPVAGIESLERLRKSRAPAAELTGRRGADPGIPHPRRTESTVLSSAPSSLPKAPVVARVPVVADVAPGFHSLDALREAVSVCVKCPHLMASRTTTVFGIGNPRADLMFVGEAPGAEEDRAGEPFVGESGVLLTKMIVAMGFSRQEVYIANVLKCRPDMPSGASDNRRPTAREMAACLPYLREQIRFIAPKVIVATGAVAMEGLFGETGPIGKIRGRWHDFSGTPVMATYHPAYLLQSGTLSNKRKVWEDLLQVLERLNLPVSEKQRGFFLPKS